MSATESQSSFVFQLTFISLSRRLEFYFRHIANALTLAATLNKHYAFSDKLFSDEMNYDTVITEFNKQFEHLKKFGLKVQGVGNLIGDHNVISISTPFIFDRTKLPDTFMGFDIRDGTPENEMPTEFQNINPDKEFIWAYQRFENYIDTHADLIRNTLDNPKMTRQEMRDALCFGDFNKHKEKCIKWEIEGKIPKWTEKGSR